MLRNQDTSQDNEELSDQDLLNEMIRLIPKPSSYSSDDLKRLASDPDLNDDLRELISDPYSCDGMKGSDLEYLLKLECWKSLDSDLDAKPLPLTTPTQQNDLTSPRFFQPSSSQDESDANEPSSSIRPS